MTRAERAVIDAIIAEEKAKAQEDLLLRSDATDEECHAAFEVVVLAESLRIAAVENLLAVRMLAAAQKDEAEGGSMTATMLTPEERTTVQEMHQQWKVEGYCQSCDLLWPCPTSMLLDALDAETVRADANYARLEQMATERLKVIYENAALQAEYDDAVARADAAEERLAIQIETNLAFEKVVKELELQAGRLADALQRVEFHSIIDGGDGDPDGTGILGHFLCPYCGASMLDGSEPKHRDHCRIAAALDLDAMTLADRYRAERDVLAATFVEQDAARALSAAPDDGDAAEAHMNAVLALDAAVDRLRAAQQKREYSDGG
jgi:hypothetical protein